MKKIVALLGLLLLVVGSASSKGMIYHDARKFPLYGTAVKNDSVTYTRLPYSLKTKVRKLPSSLRTSSENLCAKK